MVMSWDLNHFGNVVVGPLRYLREDGVELVHSVIAVSRVAGQGVELAEAPCPQIRISLPSPCSCGPRWPQQDWLIHGADLVGEPRLTDMAAAHAIWLHQPDASRRPSQDRPGHQHTHRRCGTCSTSGCNTLPQHVLIPLAGSRPLGSAASEV